MNYKMATEALNLNYSLKERLAKKYSENEIKLVEQYLEEKGPTLVKKLTN